MEIEDHIIITADTEAELNGLIDEKLKTRYLLQAAAYEQEGQWHQAMILPGNIDSEMTLSGGFKMLIGGALYITVLYYFI